MPIPKDIKKSGFVEVPSNEPSDSFDFIRSNQNLRISFTNLAASLGTSGLIETLGEITGIPVLNKSGGVNYIRNILAGAGILASISPQNGISLEHNFTVDKTGVPIMIDEGSASPTIRSIRAGTGITVGGSGGEIQISTSGVVASTKTIQVFTESDFPTPIGGVITLDDDTEYFLQNDITTANRFVLGESCVLKGADAVVITLTYTGSGTMLTAADKNFKIQDLHIVANTGTLFNVSSTTTTHIFRAYNLTISCYNMGNFQSMLITYMFNAVITILNNGFTFTGSHRVGLFSTISIVQIAGSSDTFDLGSATFDSFTIDKALFTVNSSGYVLDGLASSANINANGLGSVFNCQQLGSATFLSPSMSPYDDRWEMLNNPDIINSLDLVLATRAAGAVGITLINTPILIGATWTTIDAHRFSGTTGGRWTYNGKGTHVSITASISGAAASVTDTYTFYLYKNGVQIPLSGVSRLFSTSIGNITLIWDLQIANADYLELWVENITGTRDFIVDHISMRIRS